MVFHTGISVFMPIHVTALCSNPVSIRDVSSGASLTKSRGSQYTFHSQLPRSKEVYAKY